MATSTRKPPRKRRGSRKKRGKRGFFRLLLIWLMALALLASSVLGVALWLRTSKSLNSDWLEGLLIAAGVDLQKHRRVVVQDGIERWKVELPSRAEKGKILKGIRHVTRNQRLPWKEGRESLRGGEYLQVVELEKANGQPLRIIFAFRAEPPAEKTKPPPSRDIRKPMVVIILDDIGQKDVSQLALVLELKLPITFAVLPHVPHATSSALYFHQHQYEIMLHMPMEPDNYPENNPGRGAIFSNFGEKQILQALRRAIKKVPFASGVNNHMGSKITANRALMRPVLQELKKEGLFYVDSRTNAQTIAHSLALSLGLRTAKRDVFLDAEASYEFSMKQLKEVRSLARAKGGVIAIGHPYPTTLRALHEEMPKMDREGFRFVFASELVDFQSGRM